MVVFVLPFKQPPAASPPPLTHQPDNNTNPSIHHHIQHTAHSAKTPKSGSWTPPAPAAARSCCWCWTGGGSCTGRSARRAGLISQRFPIYTTVPS